ncbi:MAG: S8 family serine peptidase [Planctomycetes bacterium]|nr:S8 family serine peptidase [Planctomycetota bacterium]
MMRTLRLAILALLLGFFGRAIAQDIEVDALMNLGDTFNGRIAFPSDSDLLAFRALEGTTLNATLTGKGTLRPQIRLFDLSTDEEINLNGFLKGAGTKSVKITKLVLPSTGFYLFLVDSLQNTTGDYTFKPTGVLPKTAKAIKVTGTIGNNDAALVIFDAFPGSKVTAIVEPAKNSLAIPACDTILGPETDIDLVPFTTIKNKKITIKNVPLTEFGTHGLLVENTGPVGDVRVTLTIKPPTIPKAVITEPAEATGPGAIQGHVDTNLLPTIAEIEPNDTVQAAQQLGAFSVGDALRVLGSMGGSDVDGFTVAFQQSMTLDLNLLFSATGGVDLDIAFFDRGTGQQLLLLDSTVEPEAAEIDVTVVGQPFVVDIVVFSAIGTSDYLLTLVGSAPAAPGFASANATGGMSIRKIPAAGTAPKSGRRFQMADADRYLELDKPMMTGEFVVQLRDEAASISEFSSRRGVPVRHASPHGLFVAGVPQLTPRAGGTREERLATYREQQRVRLLPEVAFAEPNYLYHAIGSVRAPVRVPAGALAAPNDPGLPFQWHYPLIKATNAWDITQGSANVIAAVIDTGIVAHPDLTARDSGTGFDFISDPANALDGNGIDNNPTDPGDQSQPNGRSSWHGTHVAGTVGASTNNGTGLAGMDWNCKLMHLRVLGAQGGTNFDINESIRYAARLSNVSGVLPPQKANVINMSLGGAGFSQAQQNAVTAARNAGVVIVAAAGNENSSQPSFPASYTGVISVAAVDLNKARAPYSNFGPNIDVAAPGGDVSKDNNSDGFPDGVLSTYVDDSNPNNLLASVEFLQGTSMASPHVAGLCALLLSVNSTLTPDQVEAILESTAEDLGTAGFDNVFGHGLVNALAAVQQADPPGQSDPPQLSLSTTTLDFGKTSTQLTFSIANVGGGTLSFNATESENSGGNWLSITPNSGNAPSTITATVNRTGLSPGIFTGQIQITSNGTGGGAGSVSILMEVPAATGGTLNIGDIFVLAVDPDSLGTVGQAITTQAVGDFAMTDVDPGSYLVFAGPDLDGDGFICGLGEPCGLFPSFGLPTLVDVLPETTTIGVNFVVSDQIEIGGFAAGLSGLLQKPPAAVVGLAPKGLKLLLTK